MFNKFFHSRTKESFSGSCQNLRKYLKFKSVTNRVPAICYQERQDEEAWYPPSMVGASAISARITETRQIDAAIDLLSLLEGEAYRSYLINFYKEGLRRFGPGWGYADIVTVLLTLAEFLQPRRYLEIGVRRGRSVCAVAAKVPDCDVVMFDMWIENYAGLENPGPDFVRTELGKVGFRGRTTFVDGDSHVTLPRYLKENPGAFFDLITVDGDHSEEGASRDLLDVLPTLTVGGAIVFDDICHPLHPRLREVWHRIVVEDPHFSTWSYEDVGFGVGFGIRRF
jgi:predicted O-methyltransferase YrrM